MHYTRLLAVLTAGSLASTSYAVPPTIGRVNNALVERQDGCSVCRVPPYSTDGGGPLVCGYLCTETDGMNAVCCPEGVSATLTN